MKSATLSALALALAVTWLPYGALIPGAVAGNPNDDSYVGQPGGVYDVAANPPRTDAVVTYDPNAPLPKPVDNTLGSSGSAVAAPPAPR
jgi:hypothetical protein